MCSCLYNLFVFDVLASRNFGQPAAACIYIFQQSSKIVTMDVSDIVRLYYKMRTIAVYVCLKVTTSMYIVIELKSAMVLISRATWLQFATFIWAQNLGGGKCPWTYLTPKTVKLAHINQHHQPTPPQELSPWRKSFAYVYITNNDFQ